MTSWAKRLQELGRVHRFDYPYMKSQKRRPPDRLPKLIEAHHAELRALQQDHSGAIYLVGKSMGSRVGCHLSLEVPVTGVLCFGYPLQSAGRKKTLRDAVLRQLSCPTLLIQGTRDPLCPLPTLEALLPELPKCVEHYIVPGGDHGLILRKMDEKSLGYDQERSDLMILEQIKKFTKLL